MTNSEGENVSKRSERFVVADYPVEVPADGFLLVRAWQRGIDVKLELFDDGENSLQVIDGPSGAFGLEELAVLLLEGHYRVEVTSKHPPSDETHVEITPPVIRLASERDRRWAEASAAVVSGRAAFKRKEFELAQQHLESGLRVAEQESLSYWEAYAHEQLARVSLEGEDLAQALLSYENAISGFEALPGEGRREAGNRQNAAYLLLGEGRVNEAMLHLEKAWPIFEQQRYSRGVAVTALRLAPAYLAKGQFQSALDHLDRAKEALESLKDGNLEANLYLERGRVLLAVSRTEDALQAYAQATELYKSTGNERDLPHAWYGLASSALQMGKLERAESVIEAALTKHAEAGLIRAGFFLTRGNLRRLQGREPEARDDLDQALELAVSLKERKPLADVLLSLGHIETQGGRAQAALIHLKKAQDLYDEMGHRSGSASSQARTAEALRSLGCLEEALAMILPVLTGVERLRASASKQEHRLSFFASFRQDYFAIARDILLDLDALRPGEGFAQRAFVVDERRRARELLDSLRAKGSRAKESLRDEGPWLPERNIEAIELDVPALQTSLSGDTIIMAFSLGEPHSLLWCVSRDRLDTYRLPSASEIESRVKEFRAELLKFNGRSRQQVEVLGRTLSEMLLSEMLLGGAQEMSGKERWVIVTEGGLQGLPFAGLPLPGEDGRVVEAHELVYFPSATALAELRSHGGPRASRPRIAAWADPVFEPDDERLADSVSEDLLEIGEPVLRKVRKVARGQSLDRLPQSGDEARFIVSLAPGGQSSLMTGFNVNRGAFESVDWRRFDVLHLATHALLHAHGDMSALVFSLLDSEGQAQDGLLSAGDISRLTIPLDLVVLSACETGVGESIRGEGMLSLARAFLDAGASRVVSSLWSIEDGATADLMKAFYRAQFQEGLAPAAALRRAQLQMMANPEGSLYTWAGFTLQGDWN